MLAATGLLNPPSRRVFDTMRSRRRSLDEAYVQGENIVENPV